MYIRAGYGMYNNRAGHNKGVPGTFEAFEMIL